MDKRPHFLLFSESRDQWYPDRGRRGCWRFQLESVAGTERLEAADSERGVSGERLALLAVVRGLEALDQPSRVTLITSSDKIRRGLRFGLDQWRENDWMWEHFGKLVPIKNRDLWQRLDRALRIHQVECRTFRYDEPHLAPAPRHQARITARQACSSRRGRRSWLATLAGLARTRLPRRSLDWLCHPLCRWPARAHPVG